jgi:hypothetical protein
MSRFSTRPARLPTATEVCGRNKSAHISEAEYLGGNRSPQNSNPPNTQIGCSCRTKCASYPGRQRTRYSTYTKWFSWNRPRLIIRSEVAHHHCRAFWGSSSAPKSGTPERGYRPLEPGRRQHGRVLFVRQRVKPALTRRGYFRTGQCGTGITSGNRAVPTPASERCAPRCAGALIFSLGWDGPLCRSTQSAPISSQYAQVAAALCSLRARDLPTAVYPPCRRLNAGLVDFRLPPKRCSQSADNGDRRALHRRPKPTSSQQWDVPGRQSTHRTGTPSP